MTPQPSDDVQMVPLSQHERLALRNLREITTSDLQMFWLTWHMLKVYRHRFGYLTVNFHNGALTSVLPVLSHLLTGSLPDPEESIE